MNQGLHLLAPNFAPCEIHANLGGNFVELDFFLNFNYLVEFCDGWQIENSNVIQICCGGEHFP
jgi:hypothetical protein